MSDITATAHAFFEACETGKGWAGCAPYCTPDASFAAQAEPLADIRTLKDYADWMKGLIAIMPDGKYDLKAWAVDAGRNSVIAFATFVGIVSLTLALIGRRSPHNPAKAMARLTLSYGAAQIIAPAMTGYLVTATGNYRGALWITAAVMTLGVGLLWAFMRCDAAPATSAGQRGN